MRGARGLWLRVVLVAIAGTLLWGWTSWKRHREMLASKAIPDLSISSPLNQQGGGSVAAEAYEIYSALYHAPMEEPLAFAEDSMTDIPQVNGGCLKPSTPEERAMADAFAAANRQSHRWSRSLRFRRDTGCCSKASSTGTGLRGNTRARCGAVRKLQTT